MNASRRGSRGRTEDGEPNPVDIHVGKRVRLRRTLLGMSQEKLGEALGLTFQQVQKYEHGANRIGASRLFDLSRILDVPISFFFDDMSEETRAQAPSRMIGSAPAEASRFEETVATYVSDPALKRETVDLVRTYYSIRDPQVRRRVYELAKTLGDVHTKKE